MYRYKLRIEAIFLYKKTIYVTLNLIHIYLKRDNLKSNYRDRRDKKRANPEGQLFLLLLVLSELKDF